jgi:hypothetical protein
MTKPTYDYCLKYAKLCGHKLTKESAGYILETPYGKYHRDTLKEIDRQITKDHKRLVGARF